MCLILTFRGYEAAEISASNQIFYLLPELYAIVRSVPVVPVELTIPRVISLVGSDLIWVGHLRNCSCCTLCIT